MTLHVFGRLGLGAHPLQPALVSCLNSMPSVDSRAIACGLIHDHRVSPERENEYMNTGPDSADYDGVFKSLQHYRLNRVLKPPADGIPPDYLNASLNESNFVTVGAAAGALEPSTKLVTVLRLNGLGTVLRQARGQCRLGDPRYQWYDGFPETDRTDLIGTWLDRKLLDVEPIDQRPEIAEILRALNVFNRDPNGQRPTWATLAPDVLNEPESEPDRWRDAVGAGHLGANEWLAVLTYSAATAAATNLVRPTILDAGDNPWHFVSPEGSPLRDGGFVMDLNPGHVRDKPRSEYLHPPIIFDIAHWDNAGMRCKKTKTPPPVGAGPARRRHHNLLQTYYPGDAYFGRCSACACGLC